MKKIIICTLIIVAVTLLLQTDIHAKSDNSFNSMNKISSDEIDELIDNLPEDIEEDLPDYENPQELIEKIDQKHLFSLSGKLFKKAFSVTVKALFTFIGIMLVSAVFRSISASFTQNKLTNDICMWLTTLCISYEAYSMLYSLFGYVSEYINNINEFMTGMTAVMTGVYIAGGNAATAIVSSAGIASAILVIQKLGNGFLLPVLKLSFAATLASSVSNSINLSGIAALLRKILTTVITVVSTILSLVFLLQNTIAQAQDSVAAKSVKFAASSTVPVIGGAVGDSVRTLASSVGLIRSTTGALGVFIIILMTLVPLCSLFATKLSLVFAEQIAVVLEVSENQKFFSEIIKLINFMIAIVAVFSMLFIFYIAIYMKSTTAISA